MLATTQRPRSPLLLSCLLLVGGLPAAQEHWSSFRGWRAGGVAEGQAPPLSWNVPEGENVAWRTEVPGLAHSSPVLWGDRLFVTSAVRLEGESELSSLYGSPGYGAGDSVPTEGAVSYRVLCLDARTGELLWERVAHEGVPRTKRHPKATHANSTPACDAERVVAFFGSEGLYAYDHAGELLWKRDLGVLDAAAPGMPEPSGYEWGFASSPVLAGERVIVQCDVEGQSFVAALDAASGKTLWRTDRDENSTWCTPTVHPTSCTGEPQVVLNGYKHIGGYDLATGRELWKLVGGGDVPVPTPVAGHGLLFLTSSHGPMRPIYAIDERASGRLTMDPEECEHMAWSHRNRGVYMQTLLVYGEELYACSDGGILSAFDAGTGQQLYRERVTSGTGFSGSPVAADGRVYLTGESGTVFVVAAGIDFELLAENDLGETCLATPAIADDRLYFRTRHHVVAVGE